MCTEIEPVTALHLKCGPNALVLFTLPAALSPLPSFPAPPTLFYFYSLCLSESLCLSDHWLPVLPAAACCPYQCCHSKCPQFFVYVATAAPTATRRQCGAPCVAPSAAAPHKSCSRRAATVASVSKQCAQSTPPKN